MKCRLYVLYKSNNSLIRVERNKICLSDVTPRSSRDTLAALSNITKLC